MEPMHGIPILLDVAGWRVLIVGGGAVAARRARALTQAGAWVTAVAPAMGTGIEALAVERVEASFDPAEHRLADYRLVVVATDDADTNARVAAEIAKLPHPPLCNRADAGRAGDVSFMASHREGPLTLAVHTGGASASAGAGIRDALAGALDPAWPGVLPLAQVARQQVQQEVTDPAKRAAILRRLTDDEALACFRLGGAEALQSHYRDIMRGSQ